MNYQQLRCIVEIARVGSITKAAENLYMNQPNLSRTVIEFEKEYGVTLFIRNFLGFEVLILFTLRDCSVSPTAIGVVGVEIISVQSSMVLSPSMLVFFSPTKQMQKQ